MMLFTIDVSIQSVCEADIFINDKFSIVSQHCELARPYINAVPKIAADNQSNISKYAIRLLC